MRGLDTDHGEELHVEPGDGRVGGPVGQKLLRDGDATDPVIFSLLVRVHGLNAGRAVGRVVKAGAVGSEALQALNVCQLAADDALTGG